MQESCRLVALTYDMLEKNIKPGMSTYELDQMAEKFILSKNPTKENIDEITRNAIGNTFSKILEQCGVFERNEEGRKQFLKFVEEVNKN